MNNSTNNTTNRPVKRGSNRQNEKLEISNSEDFRKRVKRGMEQLKVYLSTDKPSHTQRRTMKELSMPMEGNGKDKK